MTYFNSAHCWAWKRERVRHNLNRVCEILDRWDGPKSAYKGKFTRKGKFFYYLFTFMLFHTWMAFSLRWNTRTQKIRMLMLNFCLIEISFRCASRQSGQSSLMRFKCIYCQTQRTGKRIQKSRWLNHCLVSQGEHRTECSVTKGVMGKALAWLHLAGEDARPLKYDFCCRSWYGSEERLIPHMHSPLSVSTFSVIVELKQVLDICFSYFVLKVKLSNCEITLMEVLWIVPSPQLKSMSFFVCVPARSLNVMRFILIFGTRFNLKFS